MERMEIEIERTKKNFPALWESGGSTTNSGWARIIARPDGGKKKPVYIRGRGHLCNAHHALFVVVVGDLIVDADHHRGDYKINIFKIVGFEDEYALVELMYEFSQGEWDAEPPASLKAAIEAAKEKAACFHCKRPHYYIAAE